MGNPPLRHERACSTVKEDPHSQWRGMLEGVHPYMYFSARASLNAPLCRQKPNSSMGKEVSQFDAPFSLASSMAFLPGAGSLFFSTSADFKACLRRCCWTADLAVIWASKHLYEYSCRCSRICSTRGPHICLEAVYSMSEVATGLRKPSPPNLACSAKRSLLRSLGGGWPVRDGISLDLMIFSRVKRRWVT